MTAHEETWAYDGNRWLSRDHENGPAIAAFEYSKDAAGDARGQLASAAPDMARVLLEVLDKLNNADTLADLAESLEFTRDQIDAALRKAGVQ